MVFEHLDSLWKNFCGAGEGTQDLGHSEQALHPGVILTTIDAVFDSLLLYPEVGENVWNFYSLI